MLRNHQRVLDFLLPAAGILVGVVIIAALAPQPLTLVPFPSAMGILAGGELGRAGWPSSTEPRAEPAPDGSSRTQQDAAFVLSEPSSVAFTSWHDRSFGLGGPKPATGPGGGPGPGPGPSPSPVPSVGPSPTSAPTTSPPPAPATSSPTPAPSPTETSSPSATDPSPTATESPSPEYSPNESPSPEYSPTESPSPQHSHPTGSPSP